MTYMPPPKSSITWSLPKESQIIPNHQHDFDTPWLVEAHLFTGRHRPWPAVTVPRLRHGVQEHVALHVLRGGFKDEAVAQGAREPARVAQQKGLLVREDELHLGKDMEILHLGENGGWNVWKTKKGGWNMLKPI